MRIRVIEGHIGLGGFQRHYEASHSFSFTRIDGSHSHHDIRYRQGTGHEALVSQISLHLPVMTRNLIATAAGRLSTAKCNDGQLYLLCCGDEGSHMLFTKE